MDINGKTVVVTGAAAGIGRALAVAFAHAQAAHVVCADRDIDGCEETARLINGIAVQVDVSHEHQIKELIAHVEATIAPIDIFCSNAGVLIEGGVDTPDDDWQRLWNINVMAHVWAARHVVPRMAARGGGYLLNTASAAGLLNQIGSAPYGVTKHAAVGLAEWLAITHADDGIKVSVLCPQAVRTAMIEGHEDHVAAIDGTLEPSEVASACLAAIAEESFLVLPHANVRNYMQIKAGDYDRWIAGMQKLNRAYRT